MKMIIMRIDLKNHLKRRGMTLTALADAVGSTKGSMSRIASGDRQPSMQMLERIATALDVHPSDLYARDDAIGAGFAEDDARPFSPRRINSVSQLARQIAPEAKRPEPFTIRRTLASFGLLRGDLILVDISGQPHQGDMVVATLADTETGSATTRIMRLVGNDLISEDMAERPVQLGDQSVAVLGTVVATLRGGGILPDAA